MEAQSLYRVRGNQPSIEQLPQGSDYQGSINTRGDIEIAIAGGGGRVDITRMRKGWQAVNTSASPATPVAALPTTTAQLTLWNGEQDPGRFYVIDALGAVCATTAPAATSLSLVVCMNVGRQTAPTGALTQRGTAGQPYSGYALVAVGATIVNDGWFPVGSSVVSAANEVGATVQYLANGAFIVPPGYQISMAVLSNEATDARVRQWIRWHEVLLPIGG